MIAPNEDPGGQGAEPLTSRIDAAVALLGGDVRDDDVLPANRRRLARDADEW